jgi:hypothetical protein
LKEFEEIFKGGGLLAQAMRGSMAQERNSLNEKIYKKRGRKPRCIGIDGQENPE